jgi:pimeloyl-ACP methyl ester carboxylesterase
MIQVHSKRIRGARVRWSESVLNDTTSPARPTLPTLPILVCLHGYPDTLRVFEPLQRALAGRVRVVAIDWPGQGGSEACGVRSPEERARWLNDTLHALGLRSVALYGHDMGALPALLAASEPSTSRVAIHHVFVSNALISNRYRVSPEIKLLRASRLYRIALPLAPSIVFERCMRTFFESTQSRNSLAWESEMRAHFIQSAAEIAHICAAYDASLRSNALDAKRLRVPVSVLWGTRTMHFDETHGTWLASHSARSTFTRFEGGPHWMVATHASEIANIVQAVLQLSEAMSHLAGAASL